jgi:DNA-binding protein H-NS
MKATVKHMNLEAMLLDQLWELHEKIGSLLAAKLEAEKRELEARLDELGRKVGSRRRRPYPKVVPKFQNPEQPSQTWAGRGRQPHWVRRFLDNGSTIDDLRIERAAYDKPPIIREKPRTIPHD